jgi:hypothetical protein
MSGETMAMIGVCIGLFCFVGMLACAALLYDHIGVTDKKGK